MINIGLKITNSVSDVVNSRISNKMEWDIYIKCMRIESSVYNSCTFCFFDIKSIIDRKHGKKKYDG